MTVYLSAFFFHSIKKREKNFQNCTTTYSYFRVAHPGRIQMGLNYFYTDRVVVTVGREYNRRMVGIRGRQFNMYYGSF